MIDHGLAMRKYLLCLGDSPYTRQQKPTFSSRSQCALHARRVDTTFMSIDTTETYPLVASRSSYRAWFFRPGLVEPIEGAVDRQVNDNWRH